MRWQNFRGNAGRQRQWVAKMLADGFIRYSEDSGLVHIQGTCAECGHSTSDSQPVEVFAATQRPQRGKHRAMVTLVPVTAQCACQGQHGGRPRDVKSGCGAFGPYIPGSSD